MEKNENQEVAEIITAYAFGDLDGIVNRMINSSLSIPISLVFPHLLPEQE